MHWWKTKLLKVKAGKLHPGESMEIIVGLINENDRPRLHIVGWILDFRDKDLIRLMRNILLLPEAKKTSVARAKKGTLLSSSFSVSRPSGR